MLRLTLVCTALFLSLACSAQAWSLDAGSGLRAVEAGFATADGQVVADSVVAEREGAVELAGGGRRVTVTVQDGRVAVAVAPAEGVVATHVVFAARDDERFLGFGERSNASDQRGNEVENVVAEGPYQPEEDAVIAAFVPPPGFRPGRPDATYFPIPWLLSTAGYGVLVANDEPSRFRLATPDRPDVWSVEVDAPRLGLRVFAGPRPADVLRRMTAAVGRQPPAAAPFYFGPWWQPVDDEADVETLRRADAPSSLAQTYTHYLPCGDQRGRDQRARTARFHDAGLAVTTYVNPMVCESYEPLFSEAAAAGALTKDPAGGPYRYRYTGASQFLVGQFDFSGRPGVELFGRLLGEAVADGYDGWMEDFGEYTPFDAVSADGTPGPAMHNRYPVLYHRAAREFARGAPRPLARFNRSGWTGAARESQIVWGGDPTVGWGFDGLRSAVTNGLTMGLSGVSLWGSDVGGFFALLGRRLEPELLQRWIELGAVSGVMRTQANGFSIPRQTDRPQITDPEILPVWRRYAKLRTQLYPYVSAAQAQYDRSGLPIMRHLALAYPRDRRAVAVEDAFLFGPDVLAAPVLDEGARSRSVYLPRGRWVELWRSARMRGDGSLALRRARMRSGGRTVRVAAPLDELPLHVRAGAVLPLLPADVDTLADYGGRDVVRLRDRAGRRALLAFPVRGRAWRGALGVGERLRSRLGARAWTLRVKASRPRVYDVQAALPAGWAACSASVGGRRLRVRFSSGVARLRARVPARGTVVVGRC